MKCKLSFRVRGIASSEVKCDEHIGATSDPNSAVPATTKKTFFEVSYVAIVKEPKSAIAVQRYCSATRFRVVSKTRPCTT